MDRNSSKLMDAFTCGFDRYHGNFNNVFAYHWNKQASINEIRLSFHQKLLDFKQKSFHKTRAEGISNFNAVMIEID